MEFNKCVLLASVNTSEAVANLDSVEGQRQELRRYVTEHGLSVDDEIVIINTPLSKGDHPIDKLESYLRRHPEMRIVVVLKTDRISRSIADFVALEKLIDNVDLEVHIVKERQILRKGAIQQGRLVRSIFTLLAGNYTENLNEEVIKGQRIKAEKGEYPERPPFGYRIDRERNAIVQEPTEAAIVKELFAECAS